jgi:hypothetical protein
MLFRNGMYMKAGFDYNLSAEVIQFVPAATPQPQDTLVASYRIDPGAGNVGNIVTEGLTHRTLLAQVLCSAGGRSTQLGTFNSLGSCNIPVGALNAGDRIEIRYNYAHTGIGGGFDAQVLWGSTAILLRHGGSQDAALVGHSEASLTSTATQITTESWGTVLPFLPGIYAAAPEAGIKVDLLGRVDAAADAVAVTNFTVLRYPGN